MGRGEGREEERGGEKVASFPGCGLGMRLGRRRRREEEVERRRRRRKWVTTAAQGSTCSVTMRRPVCPITHCLCTSRIL